MLFTTNTAGLARLAADLNGAGRRASDAAWQTLRRWGQEYLRRVRQATPTAPGGGALRASWQVVEQRERGRLTIELGTSLRGKSGQPYPLYLEFGTARIAGGRVADWQPGEPPVSTGGQNRAAEHPASLVSRAGRHTPAQLPILRPIGEAMAPQAIAETRTAVANELSSSLDGKRY
ncbi:MAG TPA: HK97 gp10 family phage protein [Pirellulales bacterium]|jgi:hypothetical protein|nr:HK97 gp10 family phage protein [Pirellulales bacterium]